MASAVHAFLGRRNFDDTGNYVYDVRIRPYIPVLETSGILGGIFILFCLFSMYANVNQYTGTGRRTIDTSWYYHGALVPKVPGARCVPLLMFNFVAYRRQLCIERHRSISRASIDDPVQHKTHISYTPLVHYTHEFYIFIIVSHWPCRLSSHLLLLLLMMMMTLWSHCYC